MAAGCGFGAGGGGVAVGFGAGGVAVGCGAGFGADAALCLASFIILQLHSIFMPP